MSLPTSYPGNLIPTSGSLTILPRYPAVDEVLLTSNQVVRATAFVTDTTPVSLLNELVPHVIVTASLPAQEVDCVMDIQGLCSLTPDSGTGVSKYATVNNIPTDIVGDYIPSSTALDYNPASLSFLARSSSVLAGTPITVRLYLQLTTSSYISTSLTTLSVTAVPTPLLT